MSLIERECVYAVYTSGDHTHSKFHSLFGKIGVNVHISTQKDSIQNDIILGLESIALQIMAMHQLNRRFSYTFENVPDRCPSLSRKLGLITEGQRDEKWTNRKHGELSYLT